MSVSTTVSSFENRQQILSQKASQGLYTGGLFGLVLVSLWFLNEGNWEPDGKTLWGITIMLLASYPALMWAKRAENWIPIFEVATLITIPQYALPLLSHHRELRFYPDVTITRAALLIALYITASIVGFSISRRPLRVRKILSNSLIPNKFYHSSYLGLFIANIYAFATTFFFALPALFGRPVSVLFMGLSTISIFIAARLWGLGLLNPSKKLFFSVNLIASALISCTGLYLLHGFASIFLAIISYSASKKKIPWLTTTVFVSIISILHLGKGSMRGKYWNFGEGRGAMTHRLEANEIPSFFAEWISYGLAANRSSKRSNIEAHTSLDRASLFPIVCLAADRIPREKSYLMGGSYTSIPALFIPRVLWPEKPTALAPSDQLMIHLGLVNPDNITVNIAFGLPTEAYINFGFIGVGVLGLIIGIFYKNLSLLSQVSHPFSPIGIFSILMISLVSQSEQNAAIWCSALLQISLVCIGIPLFYNFIKRSS